MRQGSKAGAVLAVLVLSLLGTGSVRLLYGTNALAQVDETKQSALASHASRIQAAAQWERRWITPLDPNICTTDPQETSRFIEPDAENSFSVAGGSVDLLVQPQQRRVQGRWRLEGVEAAWGWLHAQLPLGFRLLSATAANASVAPDIQDGHLALALDACARQACTVTLEFEVMLDASATAIGRASSGGIWLRAADVLPRLGLDGDRLLRNRSERKAQGLPDYLTLPDHYAAVPVAAVAPAGQWRWQVRRESSHDGLAILGEQGQTTDPLDFSVVLAAHGQQKKAADGHRIWLTGTTASDAPVSTDLGNDLQTVQTCLRQRIGATAEVDDIALLPTGVGIAGLAGHPASRLAAGQLWLPQELLNDRSARRFSIAQAIALRHIADTARLRQSKSVQWLAEGLPAALALLCVAETEEPAAVQTLLQRAAEQADATMQAQADALGAVAYASFSNWVRQYAPLATLDVARRLSPQQMQRLLGDLRQGVRVQYALADTLGANRTALTLSMPLASDLRIGADGRIEGQRWRWQQGEWKPHGHVQQGWALPAPSTASPNAIHLDAWPSLERRIQDNTLANFSNPISAIEPKEPT